MTRRLLAGMAAILLPLAAYAQDGTDEIFENPDFTDGTTHWHGNGKVAGSDSTTDFITAPGSTSAGMLVELHSSSWTYVTQELRAKRASAGAQLLVEYQTSADFSLSDRKSDYGNFAPTIGFTGASVPAEVGSIVAFFDVPPVNRATSDAVQVTVYLDSIDYAPVQLSTAQSLQKFTVSMRPPPPTADDHQTFCLAFPPGHGSIIFRKISLTPGTGQSAPWPSTLPHRPNFNHTYQGQTPWPSAPSNAPAPSQQQSPGQAPPWPSSPSSPPAPDSPSPSHSGPRQTPPWPSSP